MTVIGLGVQRVAHDLATRVHLPRVREDVTDGDRSGVIESKPANHDRVIVGQHEVATSGS
jgi:hypothetical protein